MSGHEIEHDTHLSSWSSTIEELRAAMLGRLRDEPRDAMNGDGDDGLACHVRRLCADARRNGLRAEQMIIQLKRDWYALPPLRRGAIPLETDALSRVISLCVQEYYRDG